MPRLIYLAAAFCCSLISLVVILRSLFSSQWISACLSVASLVLQGKIADNPIASLPDVKLAVKNDMHFHDSDSILINQQFSKEKNWIFDNLKDKQICFAKGFFSCCVLGDGFLELGNYQFCVGTGGKKWNQSELVTVSLLLISACCCFVSLVLIAAVIRVHRTPGNIRFSDVMTYTTSVLTFLSGTLLLLGLLPIAAQALSYSFNATNFYNDMIDRLGTAYFMAMQVNWAIQDSEVTDIQAWARSIVSNMSGLGLGVDFFITLAASVLMFASCVFLLARLKREHSEKYVPGFLPQKQS